MKIRTRRQWFGAIRSQIVGVKDTCGRLLKWNTKTSQAGNPLLTYAEMQMVSSVQAIMDQKLAAKVQVL